MRATSGRGGRDTVVYDVMDMFGAQDTGAANVSVIERVGHRPDMTDTAVAAILDTLTGTAITNSTLEGWRWVLYTSPAAANLSGRHAVGQKIGVPIGGDISAAPAAGRRPLRFDFTAYVRRATPLVGGVKFGLIYCLTTGSPPAAFIEDGIEAGAEIVSDPAVNAGRWTLRIRAVRSGAIIATLDSGVSPVGDALIGLRYDHTVTPRLAGLLNGGEFAAVTGIASMPAMSTAGEVTRWGVSQRTPDAVSAGQLDRLRECRFTVSQLPGFRLTA